MTISSTNRVVQFSGNGAQVSFPFAFLIFQKTDVLVVLTDSLGNSANQTLTSQYSVAMNSDQSTNPGGTVTMLAAPPKGYTLTISSQVPQLQGLNLANVGAFYPSSITSALDYLTVLIQQLQQSMNGALIAPIADASSTPLYIPTKAQRAGYFLTFDENGNPTTGVLSVSALTDLSQATKEEAAAALASQNAAAQSQASAAASLASAQNAVASMETTLSAATGIPYVFSADGVTASFINAAFAGCSVNMLEIHVGGTYIPRSAFSISGSTVTFNSVPAAGVNNIEIFVQANTQLLTQMSADYGAVTGAAAATADYGLLH